MRDTVLQTRQRRRAGHIAPREFGVPPPWYLLVRQLVVRHMPPSVSQDILVREENPLPTKTHATLRSTCGDLQQNLT